MKKRTALLRKLKGVFRRYRSQPTGALIEKINPILRGWVNYFAVGHSSRCFAFIRLWVAKKLRRHLERARQRKGFGWKRWSQSTLSMMPPDGSTTSLVSHRCSTTAITSSFP